MQNGPTASCGVFSLSANRSRDDLHNLPECKSQTKRKKKIAAAVYLYQVDNDSEWGEISFNFEAGITEIVQLAERDTMVGKDRFIDIRCSAGCDQCYLCGCAG